MAYGKGWRRGIAITFAFVMVTSVAIPAGAIGSATVTTAGNDAATAQTLNDSTAAGPNSTDLPADAPPALLKYEAVRQTQNLSAGGKRGIQSNIDRAHDRFNTSLSFYTGPVRVNDSKAFTHDAVGIRALAHTVRTDNTSRARHIADLVYRAGNATATATVADARRLVDRYGDEMDNQGLRHSAAAHLDNAERALERAHSIPDDVDGRRYFGQRARAVTKLRLAHRQASLAMRFVDREIAPNVSIESTSDPVWDGSGNQTYVVRGNVSAVRPGTLGNVTVTVNDERTVVAQTDLVATTPGENGQYVARVNLTERVNRIEVTAIDRASDGQNEPGQQDSAMLRLDGDGLPGEYETAITETDPLDPNSDSAATAADESTNDTIDGREDFDGDRLTTIDEVDLGTDPLAADTDGDGLTDSQEVEIVRTDPLVADSDSAMTDANESDNGVLDADEDLDGDGLTNAAEFENGSSPLYNDTDADGLADPEEIDLGTDPRSSDTDGDFLSDADELKPAFETDPLDPDTDGDGVVDGNESYTTVASNESMGVSVSLTGEGNVSASTRITPPAHVRFNSEYGPSDAAVGSFADVSVDREFENASVTVEYNESAIQTNESSLGLYRFNETSGAYERLPTTIDAANDTMTGTTEHFSIIVPLDAGYAQQIVRQRSQLQPGGSGGSTQPAQTTTFDFETSSPVSIPSGSSATVNGVTWECRNDPRGGQYSNTPISGTCVIEDGNATVREETNRMRYLETDVTLPSVGQGEALFVNASLVAQIESSWSNAAVRMVVESDSSSSTDVFRIEQDYGGGTKTVAANPRMDITELAGEDVTISLRADGRWTYNRQDTMAEISVDDLAIEKRSDASVDSDGDGISDAWESGGIPLANTTRTVKLDPNDPDTDGDGWEDGEEVDMSTFHADQDLSDADVIHFPGFAWSSDPTIGDTDGDGLADRIERDGWDIPVVNRSNGNDPYRFDKQCERTGIKNGQIQWTNCEAPGENITVDSSPLTPHSDLDFVSDYDEYNETFTDPRSVRTYGITQNHQQHIEDLMSDSRMIAPTSFARQIGIESPQNAKLTDSTDDFDYIFDEVANSPSARFTFKAIDGNLRYDFWLSNIEELGSGTDPWDPDTDDDGLTDGWEIRDRIPVAEYIGIEYRFYNTESGLNPVEADSDGDGYWDGWIGVHDAGKSDKAILYRENLANGITGSERVDEQIGIHQVDRQDPGVDLFENGTYFHSNIHIGELRWGTNPTIGSGDGHVPDPRLDIEVDYFAFNPPYPQNITKNGESVLETTSENYQLYGIDINFHVDDRIERSSLTSICKSKYCISHISPTSVNAHELYLIREEFHDNRSRLHLIWATRYSPNEKPGYFPHDVIGKIPAGVGGLTGHTGSGGQTVLETIKSVPYGIVMMGDHYSSLDDTQGTLMHEIGHALSIGYLDDRDRAYVLPNIAEYYSGEHCVDGNAQDATPESIVLPSGRQTEIWSIMSSNGHAFSGPRFAFSIEELIVIDLREIPTVSGETWPIG